MPTSTDINDYCVPNRSCPFYTVSLTDFLDLQYEVIYLSLVINAIQQSLQSFKRLKGKLFYFKKKRYRCRFKFLSKVISLSRRIVLPVFCRNVYSKTKIFLSVIHTMCFSDVM